MILQYNKFLIITPSKDPYLALYRQHYFRKLPTVEAQETTTTTEIHFMRVHNTIHNTIAWVLLLRGMTTKPMTRRQVGITDP